MLEINKIYNEDCLDGMKRIDNKSVDMICCDLPYGVLNKNNPNAKWDCVIPFDKLWEQYDRIIKDDGAILLFSQGMFTAKTMMSNEKLWRYNLVWDKVLISGFLNAKRMPLRQHEDICVFYKKLPTYNPQFTTGKPLHSKGVKYKTADIKNNCYGDFAMTNDDRCGSTEKYPTSIIKFQKPHPSASVHSTQKPVELIEYLVKTYTNEGDLVLDNCMGSGTTAVACINTNRNFVGFETDIKYYNISNKRIEDVRN